MTRHLAIPLCILSTALAGPGAARAGHESIGCAQCHVSHQSQETVGALWSSAPTADGLPVFTLYSSPTFDALGTDIGQPDGASKLCLGCHDGSYPGMQAGNGTVFRPDALASTHPISFTYDSSLAARAPNNSLKDPAATPSGLGGTIAQDLLDARSKVQCTSCHDVHSTGRGANHLRFDYNPSQPVSTTTLCRTCHNQ